MGSAVLNSVPNRHHNQRIGPYVCVGCCPQLRIWHGFLSSLHTWLLLLMNRMIPVQDNPKVGEAADTSHYRSFVPLMVAARQHEEAVIDPDLCYSWSSAHCTGLRGLG